MKKTIQNGSELRREFQELNRDDYSPTAYDAMLEIMDEIDPEIELDVYTLHGSFTEYTSSELIEEFGDYYPREDYIDERLDEDDEFDEDDYLEALLSKLQDDYYIIEIYDNDYLLME